MNDKLTNAENDKLIKTDNDKLTNAENDISFFKQPILTLKLSFLYAYDILISNNRIIKDYLLLILLIYNSWKQLEYFIFLHPLINFINSNIYITIYWLFLGILSSIGLGSGINTGLLVLFPFVTKICITSISCGNTNFDIYGTNAFTCINKNIDVTPNILLILLKSLYATVFWGIGTALGEIPPYYIAYKHAISKKHKNINKYVDSLPINDFMKYSTLKIIDFLKKYSFKTILICASYPNLTFDACGIAAGLSLLPLKDFIIPTIIGKGFIKAPIQIFLIIYVLKNTIQDKSIEYIPDFISKYIKLLIQHEEDDGSINYIMIVWTIIVSTIFIFFIKSIVETIAKEQLLKINEKEQLLKINEKETDDKKKFN